MNLLHTRYFIAYSPINNVDYYEGSVDIIDSGNQYMWDISCSNWDHPNANLRFDSIEEALVCLETTLHESFLTWSWVQPDQMLAAGNPMD